MRGAKDLFRKRKQQRPGRAAEGQPAALPLRAAQAGAAPQVRQGEVGEHRPQVGVRHLHGPALTAAGGPTPYAGRQAGSGQRGDAARTGTERRGAAATGRRQRPAPTETCRPPPARTAPGSARPVCGGAALRRLTGKGFGSRRCLRGEPCERCAAAARCVHRRVPAESWCSGGCSPRGQQPHGVAGGTALCPSRDVLL